MIIFGDVSITVKERNYYKTTCDESYPIFNNNDNNNNNSNSNNVAFGLKVQGRYAFSDPLLKTIMLVLVIY